MRTLLLLICAGGMLAAQTLPRDVDRESLSRLPLLKRGQMDAESRRVLDYIAAKDRDSPPMGPGATSIYSPGVA